uniref:Lipid-binding serum glycoprotein N-terminal domain-containing protein n=1 Tax=Canis lupus familiaris TaxID=9615 RepID=A0A8C0QDJ2_CANLF
MAGPFAFTLLCGLLSTTLAETALNPPAVFSLGREVIKERLTQELKDHNAIHILQQLPLLSSIREKPAGGIPILGNVVNSILNHIIWLKVTSANILQLQVEPSDEGQGLTVKIPLDMVAGLNTPLVKTIVEMHMETEVQAIIRVNTNERGHAHLVLADCSTSQGSLRISLLHKLSSLSANAQREIGQMVSLSSRLLLGTFLEFKFPANHLLCVFSGQVFRLPGKCDQVFNESAVSLTVPYLDTTPFSLTVRQDVVNAVVASLLPPDELVVLVDYVLPELARRLKSNIKTISEKAADQLGPTQMVKILTQETPELLLDQGSPKVAQLIVLEVFATNEARRPFFTLGIEASSEAQFYTKGDRLMLNLNEISSDRIHLMNSGIGLFNVSINRSSLGHRGQDSPLKKKKH